MNNQKNTSKTFLNMAFTLFALNSKQKNYKPQIYWVIEEDEFQKDQVIVKYYNDENELLLAKTIAGVQKGIIDEEAIQKINEIKDKYISF